MSDKYDDREQVMGDFPTYAYVRIPVKNEDDARMQTAMRAARTGETQVGECRWFGPDDGVLLFLRDGMTSESREVRRFIARECLITLAWLVVAAAFVYAVWRLCGR